MEDMEEEQADAVEQAFDLDYVAQAFCSHIVPKAVLWFTGEPPGNGMYFYTEDGEGDEDDRTTMMGETTMRGEVGRVRPFRPRRRRRVNDDNPLKRADKCPKSPMHLPS